MKKTLPKTSPVLSMLALALAATQNVSAHTGVKDNVLEGVGTYTGYTITHGCADNAGGEGSSTTVDGNTAQKDVIAQSAVFPTNLATAIVGPVNSNNYFTNTLKTADLTASNGPLGTGGVVSSVDVTGGNDAFVNSLNTNPATVGLTNNAGQVAAISFDSSKWAVLTEAKFTSAIAVSYVAPSVFPEAYIKRDHTGLFRGYDSWGSVLPEGGGTVGVSSFKVTAPVLNPNSCYKGIKIYTAVINYCSTEKASKDTNNDRYDVWAGFDLDHKPAIVSSATNASLVNGSGITASTVFTNQNLMPNAASATPNADTTSPIFWSTITVNRVSPMPDSCQAADKVYLGIAPSTEDIDKYLPMAVKTKSHPNNIGKKFDPSSDPKNY